VLQYHRGLDDPQFRFEIHADYMSGWYMGLKTVFGLRLNLEAFEKALYLRGRSRYFNNPDYGTSEERVGAMRAGYDDARQNSSPSTIVNEQFVN